MTNQDQTILVTGSSGYIGRYLLSKLGVMGVLHPAWQLDRHQPSRLRRIVCVDRVRVDLPPEASWWGVDLAAPEAVAELRAVAEPLSGGVVVHFAGLFRKDVHSPRASDEGQFVRDNVLATRQIVDVLLASAYKPRLFILASTEAVRERKDGRTSHGDFVSAYAWTKRQAEDIAGELRRVGIAVACLRFGRVIGCGHGGAIPQDILSDTIVELATAASSGRSAVFIQEDQVRPYVHIEDVMNIIVDAACGRISINGTYDVVPRDLIRLRDVRSVMIDALGKTGFLDRTAVNRHGGSGDVPRLEPPISSLSARLRPSIAAVKLAAAQYCSTLQRDARKHDAASLLCALYAQRIVNSDWTRLEAEIARLAKAGASAVFTQPEIRPPRWSAPAGDPRGRLSRAPSVSTSL